MNTNNDLERFKILVSISDEEWETHPLNFSGLYDAAPSSIKHCLNYKAKKLGGACYVVNEAYTSVTCFYCEARSGPNGKSGLAIREWACNNCGAVHDRDVNAARNILRRGHSTPCKGKPL